MGSAGYTDGEVSTFKVHIGVVREVLSGCSGLYRWVVELGNKSKSGEAELQIKIGDGLVVSWGKVDRGTSQTVQISYLGLDYDNL